MQYSVQAAARATGVSEHRLRTWERRYGVPAPNRSLTGRRLYGDDDLQVIRLMSRLVDAGVPASEAARAALNSERLPEPEAPRPPISPAVSALIDSVRVFDGPELERRLRAIFDESGYEGAVGDVVMPLLRRVGEGWASAELGVACEHFTSEVVRRVIVSAFKPDTEAPEGSPVLVLACPPSETHDLGLLSLRLLLQEQPLRIIYLGADVPSAELVAACDAVRADAVCMVATTATSLPGMWLTARRLIEARRSCRIFVGGPAVMREGADSLAVGEILPSSIPAAAAHLARELGGEA